MTTKAEKGKTPRKKKSPGGTPLPTAEIPQGTEAAKVENPAPANPSVDLSKNTAKKIRVVERPTIELMSCELTQTEIVVYAQTVARIDGDLASLERQMKDKTTEFKAKIAGLKTRHGEIMRKIESGSEDREVNCVWLIDYERGEKVLLRAADRSAVRTVPLSPDERQQKLPLTETLADRVSAAEARRDAKADKPADIAPAPLPEPALPELADDQLKPGQETTDEKKIRIWWNSLDIPHRRSAIGDSPAATALLNLTYRQMKSTERDVVKAAYETEAAARAGGQKAERRTEAANDHVGSLENSLGSASWFAVCTCGFKVKTDSEMESIKALEAHYAVWKKDDKPVE